MKLRIANGSRERYTPKKIIRASWDPSSARTPSWASRTRTIEQKSIFIAKNIKINNFFYDKTS